MGQVSPRQWPIWARDRYPGALTFNVCASVLPALHNTLVKLWAAKIDSSMVVTTDTYTYISTIVEVLNEGLPRAAWCTVGDASLSRQRRVSLTYTLILAQSFLGLTMSLVILSAAIPFSASFVPPEVRDRSTTYVRITAFTAFSSALEAAVSASTRALDRPDVPLVLSAIKFSLNIVLDLLLISTFHVGKHEPTVNLQAFIQLACNISAALGGLAYFIRQQQRASLHRPGEERAGPSLSGLRDLIRPGTPTFVESAIRNTLYLWVISNIISLGSIYATAWGVFTNIRWGLVMVPVQALEATTLTFVGHNWGLFKCHVEFRRGPVAFKSSQLSQVIRPALVSVALALAFEIPLCLFLSYLGVRPFAYFLSRNDEVADVTAHMWRSIDWCYVLYGVSTQLAAILLATKPSWYLGQSLATNLLYVLPWAITCQVANLNTDNAWTYHAFVFGGSLVFSFVCVLLILVRWAWVVTRSAAC